MKRKQNDVKFDFNDIALIPDVQSRIKSRGEINYEVNLDYTALNGKFLPIISAPMLSVISGEHDPLLFRFKLCDTGILSCLPRGFETNHIECNNEFISISLQEFIEFTHSDKKIPSQRLLVDIANGHISELPKLITEFKSKFPNSVLMVGNIANPETYQKLALAGADFIRCGIGGGSGCLTSVQLGVHYPMASLIHEINKIKNQLPLKYRAKIVADGGFSSYSDIIKALALGADFVMFGGIFNKMIDSDVTPYLWKIFPINNTKLAKFLFDNKFKLYKKFFGMSTKLAQTKISKNPTKLKTSEGIIKWNKVEYSLYGWVENFLDYLKSSMSYANCLDIEEFIGSENFIFITENSYKRFNK